MGLIGLNPPVDPLTFCCAGWPRKPVSCRGLPAAYAAASSSRGCQPQDLTPANPMFLLSVLQAPQGAASSRATASFHGATTNLVGRPYTQSTMSPPFGGCDHADPALILGLTPPGSTISPRSGLRKRRLNRQRNRKQRTISSSPTFHHPSLSLLAQSFQTSSSRGQGI